MHKYLLIIFMIIIASCSIDEEYADVYDPEQERIDSLNQSDFFAKTIGNVEEAEGNEPVLNFV